MLASLLSWPETVLLGIVEGLTEFLPISSTGHLLVVQSLLGLDSGPAASAADTFAIAIQLGAILAVVLLYRVRLGQMFRGVLGRDPAGAAVTMRLAVAFLPAAAVGVALGDAIKDKLFGPVPVAVAWAVGGVVLLVWRAPEGTMQVEQLSLRGAAIIGVAQTVALWPGTSRSLVTLLAALALGLSLAAALEFSFLLGLATLAAASALDLVRNGGELIDQFGAVRPVAGAAVALVTAMASVRWLVGFVRGRGLSPFGWYRLAVAVATLSLVATGTI